jgi:hypothetical protein
MKAVAVLWMWSTVVVGLLAGALESAIARDTGGRLLNEALDSVLGPRKSIIPMSNPANKSWVNTIPHIRDLPITKIRMRCDQYLACGNSTPTIEISNAIIHQKVVYFNYPDQESLDIIEKFPTFFADVPNRLPSCSGKVPTAEAWLPGPRFSVINAIQRFVVTVKSESLKDLLFLVVVIAQILVNIRRHGRQSKLHNSTTATA